MSVRETVNRLMLLFGIVGFILFGALMVKSAVRGEPFPELPKPSCETPGPGGVLPYPMCHD